MSLWIYNTRAGSKTAKELAQALGCKRIKHRESEFVGHEDTVVINWGCSDLPREVRKCRVINEENAVLRTVDKLQALDRLYEWVGFPHVSYTQEREQAAFWIENGRSVVCRTIVNGHDGAGIVFATNMEELVDAPLYTLFEEAEQEYRITVLCQRIICRQRKVRIPGKEKYDDRFKTTAGGYGFEVVPLGPRQVTDAAQEAVECLGLEFGGVDVILTPDKRAVVLEVNSAPQLTPYALKRFVEIFREEVLFDEV
jgi:glutathione synthase/RimK-type ligase-like ATP-grasp enzyme